MKFLLYLIYIYIKYNKNFINILIMFITKKKNVKKILKNNTGTAKISIIQSKTLSKTKSKKHVFTISYTIFNIIKCV